MSDQTKFILVLFTIFVAVCLTIIVGVWRLVKTKNGIDQVNSKQRGSEDDGLNERSGMQVNDWFNAVVNIVVGLFLGIAIVNLSRLITAGYWPLALFLLILFAGYLLFDKWFGVLVDKVFPSGIRPARKSVVRKRAPKSRAPLPRLLSLPVGILLGIALDWLGLSDKVLGMIW